MTELLTAAQMRAIEQAAIESGQVTGLELMERAGQGVVEAIFEEWPELAADRPEGAREADAAAGGLAPRPAAAPQSISETLKAVVLCGPGNNGGDGFVVARLLAARGWAVEVFLYGDPKKLPPDARVNYERWCESGEVHDLLAPPQSWPRELHEVRADDRGVIIDALFGTGLSRALADDLATAYSNFLSIVSLSFFPVVSVDVPTGVCSDSGKALQNDSGQAVRWHIPLCVTFHRPKVAHYLGEVAIGRVVVKSIGLDEIIARQQKDHAQALFGQLADLLSSKAAGEGVAALQGSDGSLAFSQALSQIDSQRADIALVEGIWDDVDKRSAHKFSHGHALVLTGGSGKTGAARLAARGALRIGAGLVTLGVPPSAQMEVAAQITALMLTRVADAAGLAKVLEDARLNALCLGPGLGLARARDLVPVALAAARPTVLDADALSAYAEDSGVLFAMLHERCVLTPHGGEFARLFPDIAAKLQAPATKGPAYSKVDATREAAARAGCTVLFKGADTVIADPSGQCSVHAASYERSAPWLATAGAGDVLAGFITGLLARGFAPHQAAATAAYLHVDCARSFGPGLIAEDLPEQLPRVLNDLLAKEV